MTETNTNEVGTTTLSARVAPIAPGGHKGRGWRRTFLRALRRHGHVTWACEVADVSMALAYKIRAQSPRFADAWKWAMLEARQRMIDEAEAELFRRGVEGWLEPVFQGGRLVGSRRKYSEPCLLFLLQALHPNKYRPRVENRTGPAVYSVPAPAGFQQPEDSEVARLMAELAACLAAPVGAGKALPAPSRMESSGLDSR